MTRLLGAGLLLIGGWSLSLRWGLRERRKVEECRNFLFALQRMERGIRSEQRGIGELAHQLAAERGGVGRFFGALLPLWEEGKQSLQELWEESCGLLQLPPEGLRIWRELGRRLCGDSESVCRSISAAAEELSALQYSLKESLNGRIRTCSTLSLCGAAFLVIVLL